MDCSGILVDCVDSDGREESSKAPSQQTSCERPFHRNVAVPRATEGRPERGVLQALPRDSSAEGRRWLGEEREGIGTDQRARPRASIVGTAVVERLENPKPEK